MITETKELKSLCARLAEHPFMTLDTEFIREKTYYPCLCLIQVGSPAGDFCIDPLAQEMDLAPFFELLQNPAVMKVFHAARQDIEVFYMLSGQIPRPLFDTQIAASVCGFPRNVGYQQLVQELLGVALDKGMRLTDWARRPLSERQIQYALGDVSHLRDIYLKLSASLQTSGRAAWIREEMDALSAPETYRADPNEIWRRIKNPLRRPKELHIFARLCAWREEKARAKNRPRRHILKDDVLVELALQQPASADDLAQMRHCSSGFAQSSYAPELLGVIRQALADPPALYPQADAGEARLTPAQRSLAELLAILLGIVSDQAGVAADLVATAAEIDKLARGKTDGSCLTGWRREIFGNQALAMKQGKLALRYNPQRHRVDVEETPPISAR